jgi:hypothetical protein
MNGWVGSVPGGLVAQWFRRRSVFFVRGNFGEPGFHFARVEIRFVGPGIQDEAARWLRILTLKFRSRTKFLLNKAAE